jgi:hypothetical protein
MPLGGFFEIIMANDKHRTGQKRTDLPKTLPKNEKGVTC